jgi:hypothetical protein
VSPRLLLATPLLFALACDAPTAQPDAEGTERIASRPADIPEGEAEAAATPPARDLGELERELAKHELELRQLGVELVTTDAFADGEAATTATATKAETRPTAPAKDRNTSKAGGSKKAKQDEKTATAGTPGSSRVGTGYAGDSTGSGGGKSTDESVPRGEATPDPAKSIQSPPADRSNEQAEERCPLICSLADSTCELHDEICELADRHTDDDAYSFACERASNDCQQAREACLECLG